MSWVHLQGQLLQHLAGSSTGEMLNLSLPSHEARRTTAAPLHPPSGPAWISAACPLLEALALQSREYCRQQHFVAVLWEANLSMAFASAENYSSSFFKDVNARCLALPGADEDGLPGLGDGR